MIMGPTRVSDIMGKGETRCPYCVVGDNLYPMKVLRNGRLICEKCGHIVFPGDGVPVPVPEVHCREYVPEGSHDTAMVD